MFTDENNLIKIVLLGDRDVGCTSLLKTFFNNKYDEHSEIIDNNHCSGGDINYKNENYKYFFWDSCASRREFGLLRIFFVRNAHIILIVYSIIDRQSFETVDFWVNFVKENIKDDKHIIALVANKNDLIESQVMDKEGEDAAKKYGFEFLSTSAKDNPMAFKNFVNHLIEEYIEKSSTQSNNKPENATKKNKCLIF